MRRARAIGASGASFRMTPFPLASFAPRQRMLPQRADSRWLHFPSRRTLRVTWRSSVGLRRDWRRDWRRDGRRFRAGRIRRPSSNRRPSSKSNAGSCMWPSCGLAASSTSHGPEAGRKRGRRETDRRGGFRLVSGCEKAPPQVCEAGGCRLRPRLARSRWHADRNKKMIRRGSSCADRCVSYGVARIIPNILLRGCPASSERGQGHRA